MKNIIYYVLFISILVHGQTFKNIEFTGDVDRLTGEFDRSTLLKVSHIEYPAIYKVWKKNPTFESDEIDDFVDNILEYSKSMGYYRAEVNATTDEDSIYIHLKKNEAIKVHSIKIDELFNQFILFKEGERFKTVDFSTSKKKISRYLEENGYPTYKMNIKAYVDIDLYQVNIEAKIDKGEKRYFGKTDINNSADVDNDLIQEQISYEPNELYNILKLEESYDNIYRLGAFDKIQMQADFNNTDGVSDIHLVLEEGKNKEFATGLGYDTEDGARGIVEYVDHNFFGNLKEFRAGLKIAQRGYNAYTNYYDPRIDIPWFGRIDFRNELGYSKWNYDAYVENLFTERVTFGKKFIGLEHFFGFQHERTEITSDIPLFLAGKYKINSLFYRVMIDKRDDEMDAKNGYYTSFYIEKSMKQLGSDIDYLKVLGEARYIKEFKPMVYAVKLKVGSISEETPPFKHFFLGGAMSNRGYEYRDLGRHVGIYPVGGVSMIDGSFEARYYLTDDFATVGFFDVSKLSEKVNDFQGRWYQSYGLGVRYNSVIGPLRLDVGYPTEGGFALHLGIGQVF